MCWPTSPWLTALAVLILMQFEPALLACQGWLLPDALWRERVVDKEVWAAVHT